MVVRVLRMPSSANSLTAPLARTNWAQRERSEEVRTKEQSRYTCPDKKSKSPSSGESSIRSKKPAPIDKSPVVNTWLFLTPLSSPNRTTALVMPRVTRGSSRFPDC